MREVTYRRTNNIRRIIIGVVVAVILLAALVIFGLFRVQEVVISGNHIYTAEEIQSTIMQDGLCKNTLYLLYKFKDDSKMSEALPFLNSIEVKMVTPYKVQIKVYEKQEIGYYLKGTDYIYFDRDGMIVQITKEVHEGVPQITGQTIGKAERYSKLAIEDEKLLKNTIDLAQLLHKNELTPNEIKFDENEYITLYFERVKVKLGPAVDIDEKIITLKSVYGQISGQEGILHMETFTTDTQTIAFKQGEEEENLSIHPETSAEEADPVVDGQEENATSMTEAENDGVPTYKEGDGTFSVDADGNSFYTDAAGRVTYNVEQYNYTDENGGIITDGYGYIDPYTGGYIIK